MKKSKIQFEVTLDENNILKSILWNASENASDILQDTKAIAISVWDSEKFDLLQLDLWTKEMNVDEMKRFYINQIGSASNTLLNATGDIKLANRIKYFCEELIKDIDSQ